LWFLAHIIRHECLLQLNQTQSANGFRDDIALKILLAKRRRLG
jgi:hypothetical protein